MTQQIRDAANVWQMAAREFSYTAEATTLFSEPIKRSELATLQLADVAPIHTSVRRKHVTGSRLKLNSGAKLMLLFAQSVLEPESPSINAISTATTIQHAMPFCTASAPLGNGSSTTMTPPTVCHIALLRAALLTVKAATLLDIGDTSTDRVRNTMALWETAELIMQPMHDDVGTHLQHTETYATESKEEAEHLSSLLVQTLLQTISEYLGRVSTLQRAGTCCKLLQALLATRQQGVSQPLSHVVAFAIASQSEFTHAPAS